MKKLIPIFLVLISACSAKTIPVQVSLQPCPPPVELVKMTDSDFAAFGVFKDQTPGAIKIINKREDQLQARIDTLCGIIESTREVP